MNLQLTEMQNMVVETARELGEKKLFAARVHLDETEEYPLELMKEAGNLGLVGVAIPEAYGGMGQGVLSLSLATEEIAKVDPAVSTVFMVTTLGALPILISGTEEQKQKYLPKLASGEWIGAFGLTESNAGSDALALQTKAVKDGDYYVLNGSKAFITSAGQADVYTIFAVTNPSRGKRGISGFIVTKDMPGFSVEKKEKKMGIRCSQTCGLVFNNCRVPAANLIGGKEGIGAITLLNTLNRSRIGIGAQSIGAAVGAMKEALAYARERKQFGKPITEFQAIQRKFANAHLDIEASRALVYAASRCADAGTGELAKLGAMAKCFSSDRAMEITEEAVQVCGGIGYMRDFPVEKYMRDAKIFKIYEGTNEIQRNEIVTFLLHSVVGMAVPSDELVRSMLIAVLDAIKSRADARTLVSLGRRLLSMSLRYAKELPSFEQGIQHVFANAAMYMEAAELLVLDSEQENASEQSKITAEAFAIRALQKAIPEVSAICEGRGRSDELKDQIAKFVIG